jgi:hypothetical protein
MIKWFLLSLFLFSTAAYSQQADFIVLKKNQKTVKNFYSGTHIEFVATNGAYRNALITGIKNDSLYLQEFIVYRMPTTLGTYILDTTGSFSYAYHYNQIKSFGKVFAGVFSATALLNYSKNAVKAFMADEKAAKALELQLKNTGFAFAAPSVEYYIANLQKTTGVLDDELRPAFQQLLTVTGSVTQSQDALATALNISAATGKSVQEVSSRLRSPAGRATHPNPAQ